MIFPEEVNGKFLLFTAFVNLCEMKNLYPYGEKSHWRRVGMESQELVDASWARPKKYLKYVQL